LVESTCFAFVHKVDSRDRAIESAKVILCAHYPTGG